MFKLTLLRCLIRIIIYLRFFLRLQPLQEGPKAISVWGLKSRTNNHVESHNAILGAAIKHQSGFYTVAEKLAEDEQKKSHDLLMLLDGKLASQVHAKKKKIYVKQDKFIADRQAELASGAVTVSMFLQSMSYRYNRPADYHALSVDNEPEIDDDDALDFFVRP